jgi:hypothetical protein
METTKEQVEEIGCKEIGANIALIDFQLPEKDVSYRSKAMFCQDRDNSVWVRCERTNSAEEECVLFGPEMSDADVTRAMEGRWQLPLKLTKLQRPLENNQVLSFQRRILDDDEDEEEKEAIHPMSDPMAIFRGRAFWKPQRPSTPVILKDSRAADSEPETEEKIMTQIICPPHQAKLYLPKPAPVSRIIKAFQETTRIDGECQGREVSSKPTLRVIEIRSITPPMITAEANL